MCPKVVPNRGRSPPNRAKSWQKGGKKWQKNGVLKVGNLIKFVSSGTSSQAVKQGFAVRDSGFAEERHVHAGSERKEGLWRGRGQVVSVRRVADN